VAKPRHRADEPTRIARRSHAAIPIAVVFLFLGLLFGAYTVVIPALLGGFLFLTSLSFLSTRLNPLSIGFYLTTKPSWTAIGLVLLVGVVLLAAAWEYWASGFAPIVP